MSYPRFAALSERWVLLPEAEYSIIPFHESRQPSPASFLLRDRCPPDSRSSGQVRPFLLFYSLLLFLCARQAKKPRLHNFIISWLRMHARSASADYGGGDGVVSENFRSPWPFDGLSLHHWQFITPERWETRYNCFIINIELHGALRFCRTHPLLRGPPSLSSR